MVEWCVHYGDKKMKVWKALSGHVLITNVGTPEQRQDLLQQAWLKKRSTPTDPRSNDGCWRSNIVYQRAEWLENALLEQLQQSVDYYLQEDPSYKQTLSQENLQIESWTNINDPGSLNLLHTHKINNFSALYYVQAQGTGDLVFLNPANLDLSANYHGPGNARMHYQPSDGDLLMWPSWMPHEVERNTSNKHRVNIAFNIKLA